MIWRLNEKGKQAIDRFVRECAREPVSPEPYYLEAERLQNASAYSWLGLNHLVAKENRIPLLALRFNHFDWFEPENEENEK